MSTPSHEPESIAWNSPVPKGFVVSSTVVTMTSPHAISKVWSWLNRMETFTKGQISPYRVEFVGQEEDPSFSVGTYNNPHGPLLNLPAMITVMDEPHYREMRYLYGSYVITFRWIRPTELKFTLKEAADNTTEVTVELVAHTKPFIKGIWQALNRFFWRKGFGWWVKRLR